jgi:anaerobic magnesium-protoporphyrin IX monomethyl ester cyclase
MIFGFPGETLRDIAHSYIFIAQMALAGINDISVFPFSPYPGRAFHDAAGTRNGIA